MGWLMAGFDMRQAHSSKAQVVNRICRSLMGQRVTVHQPSSCDTEIGASSLELEPSLEFGVCGLYCVSDGGGSLRRSAPVLGRSNVGSRASPNGIGRIGTTGARCTRGRAHSDNVVVRRHRPITAAWSFMVASSHWLQNVRDGL